MADAAARFTVPLAHDEHVYGLGARTGPMDRRGQRYTCWATDRYEGHTASTDELSYVVPFALLVSEAGPARGVYVQTSARSVFDSRDGNALTIDVDDPAARLVTIDGPAPLDVLAGFTALAGRAPLPPRWALGYQQARWGYASAEEICDVAHTLRSHGFPSDVIQLDIDHMDGYRVFTWDGERFPDPEQLLEDLHALGFRALAVVGPGVKAEPGYAVYESGARINAFLRCAPEREAPHFEAYVWPGVSVLPDFARHDVRDWWGQWLGRLFDAGVDGVICDMNEPSLRDGPMDDRSSRRVEVPPELRHADGATHAEVHNCYGELQAQATYAASLRHRPDERPFVMSRAGYSGIQRFAATWTGDNESTWEQLQWSVSELINMGVSGAVLCGADIGGFFGDCDPELLTRWMQLGAWYPVARNHCWNKGAPQEPWVHGPDVLATCRAAIAERYRYMPYLYTVVEEATRTGAPIFRGLFLHWPNDPRAHTVTDEFLVGHDLLGAPVLQQGVRERKVYLPSGRWYDLRSGAAFDGPQEVVVAAPLDGLMPLFARGGSIIACDEPFTLDVYPDADGRADGQLYEDDGVSFAYRDGASRTHRFSFADGVLSGAGSGATVRVHA